MACLPQILFTVAYFGGSSPKVLSLLVSMIVVNRSPSPDEGVVVC